MASLAAYPVGSPGMSGCEACEVVQTVMYSPQSRARVVPPLRLQPAGGVLPAEHVAVGEGGIGRVCGLGNHGGGDWGGGTGGGTGAGRHSRPDAAN